LHKKGLGLLWLGGVKARAPTLPHRCPEAARVALYAYPMNRNHLTVEMLVAAIACSPIVVAHPAVHFPAGYDAVDVAVLEWIAAEGRRLGRSFALI
jgi:hypothetical protein